MAHVPLQTPTACFHAMKSGRHARLPTKLHQPVRACRRPQVVPRSIKHNTAGSCETFGSAGRHLVSHKYAAKYFRIRVLKHAGSVRFRPYLGHDIHADGPYPQNDALLTGASERIPVTSHVLPCQGIGVYVVVVRQHILHDTPYRDCL